MVIKARNGPEMYYNEPEMYYKDHHIEVSIRANSNGWVPDVYVSYSENGKCVLKRPRNDQTFATKRRGPGSNLRKSG
jgi:hypothetical protein